MSEFFTSFSGIYGLILFVAGLGFLIFVHELGHFAVAKWCGIKVDKFAVGFDPWKLKIFSFKYGETEYVIGGIPLGGYVKMLGQDDTKPGQGSEDPRSYTQKTYLQKMAVISAGVIMNIIFGAIFLITAFMMGVEFPSNVVGTVNPNFPAAKAEPVNHDGPIGLQAGDRIVEINGTKIQDWGDIRITTALKNPDSPLNITVERPTADGKIETLNYLSTAAQVDPSQESLKIIGVAPITSLQTFDEKLITRRLGSQFGDEYRKELQGMGLRPGMKLTAIDGKPVEHPWDFTLAINDAGMRELTFTFSDEQGSADLKVETAAAPQVKIQPVKIDGTIPTDPKKQVNAAHYHLLGMRPVMYIPENAPHTGKVAENLKPGDIIKQIGDHVWPSFHNIVEEAHKNKATKFVVLRDGEEVSFELTAKNNLFGISTRPDMKTNLIAGILPDSPLAASEIAPRPGARFTKLNGQPVESFNQLQDLIHRSESTEFTLTFSETIDGEVLETQSSFTLADADRSGLRWGINSFFPHQDIHKTVFKSTGPIDGLVMGLEKTKDMVVLTYISLLRLADGNVPVTSAQGPIRMAVSGSIMADQGFAYFLFFLGMISINLAVINFLPLPILDGGHAVFLTYEKLMGKPIPGRVMEVVSYAGLFLIGGFFLFVNINDIVKLVGG